MFSKCLRTFFFVINGDSLYRLDFKGVFYVQVRVVRGNKYILFIRLNDKFNLSVCAFFLWILVNNLIMSCGQTSLISDKSGHIHK